LLIADFRLPIEEAWWGAAPLSSRNRKSAIGNRQSAIRA
jgi:hypothetical protein